MQRVPEKLNAFSVISAWLLLGTATCIAAANVQTSPAMRLATIAVWAVAGQIWALRRPPSWTESALALGCVPYFSGLAQWLPFCEQPHGDNSWLSSWGTGLAMASATAALTLGARCLEVSRSPQK